MTLDDAIERLQARVDGELYIRGTDDCQDMKLGIEALKAIKYLRGQPQPYTHGCLAGETKE